MSSRYAELLEKNERFLWNPFTQMKQYLADRPVIVARGEGVKLIDVDGREYYDGNSSMWLNVHGHGKPELNEAIAAQLGSIAHSTLLGMVNLPALELAERLVAIAPSALRKVFYSDSGSEAVEIALKMALGYWRRRGRPRKSTFLSMRNAYHVDTVGAVSVGGIELFHSEFGPLLFPTEKVSYPYSYRFDGTEAECARACLVELEERLELNAGSVAGLIVEPIVQAAGGMIVMPAGFLADVAALCRSHDVLLIADEVATGFGRTGRMFACEHEGVEPDLMTVAKGITGGYLPLAATLTTEEVYEAFYADYRDLKTFFHGHSYTGNQLGCAVALANLDLYEREGILERVQRSAELIGERLAELSRLEHVGDTRRRGLMIGIELVQDRETKEPYPWEEAIGYRTCRRAQELGLITRPLGNVVTLVPPLATEASDLEAMLGILRRAISDVTE